MTVVAAPGDEVLLPAPWFFNHEMALALRGVRAVPLPCRAADGFLPDPERAAALVGPRTRAIVLVTPNNPTGAVMPPALIGRFAELCRARGLWLVLDETYRDFLPEEQDAPHALFRRPDWRDFVVQLYSFSKAYCIPGHRVGAVAAGPAFRAEFVKAVDNIQICPPRPPQFALAWAVPALREWRAGNRARIAARAATLSAHLDGGRAGMADRRDRRLFRLGARAGRGAGLGRGGGAAGDGARRGVPAGRRVRAGRRAAYPARLRQHGGGHHRGSASAAYGLVRRRARCRW